jgi:phage baseplate assembly protein W
MTNKPKFIGCQYPLMKTPRGIMSQKNGVDQIKADILQLLLTNPGERVMLADYGVPLRKLIFEPNDVGLEIQARNMIAEAITKWEPRVVLQQVQVSSVVDTDDLAPDDPREDTPHILSIKILFYDPQNITEVQELRLEVPLGSA